MKKLIGMALVFVSIQGFAADQCQHQKKQINCSGVKLSNLNFSGNGNFLNSQVDQMDVKGNVYTKDVKILGDANVRGAFYGANTTLSANSKIRGVVDCDHCVFEKNATLYGDVVISDSEVLGDLNLNSSRNAFFQSKLNNVVVTKPNHHQRQIISLKNGTVVNNITFLDDQGVVNIDDSSTILGQVKGGRVVKQQAG